MRLFLPPMYRKPPGRTSEEIPDFKKTSEVRETSEVYESGKLSLRPTPALLQTLRRQRDFPPRSC
jgi:hypothetical protein